MASVLPLLFIGGAVILLGGKKKKRTTASSTQSTREWSSVIEREGVVPYDGRDIHWKLVFHFHKSADGSQPDVYGESDYYTLEIRTQSGEWKLASDPYKTGWGPTGSMQQYDVRHYGSEGEILDRANSYLARIGPAGDIYIDDGATAHKTS